MGAATYAKSEGTSNIINDLHDEGIHAIPADGLPIDDGLQAINSLLSYDTTKPLGYDNHPKLYFSDRCGNTLFCCSNYRLETVQSSNQRPGRLPSLYRDWKLQILRGVGTPSDSIRRLLMADKNIITLTEGEIMLARTIASFRTGLNRITNVGQPLKISNQDNFTNDLIGICGEMAFAKRMNIYLDFSFNLVRADPTAS